MVGNVIKGQTVLVHMNRILLEWWKTQLTV